MAGLFALLYGLVVTGANLHESVQNDIYNDSSKKLAESSGAEMYRDAFGNWRWTENNEIVNVIGMPGSSQGYKVIGSKSGRIYHKELSDREILADRYNRGLTYCKENGIKYFPWIFRNDLSGSVAATGIEIDTGKKYAILRRGRFSSSDSDYYMVYLEDEPHWANRGYGDYMSYDAVHDGTREMYDNDFESVSYEKHEYSLRLSLGKSPEQQDYQYWYYTKCYPISKEEYKKRSSKIDGFDTIVERPVPAKGYTVPHVVENSQIQSENANDIESTSNTPDTSDSFDVEIVENQNVNVDKKIKVEIIVTVAVLVGLFCIFKFFTDWRYAPYGMSLDALANDISSIDFDEYVNANSWIFSLSCETDFSYDEYSKYYSGDKVTQENIVRISGIYTDNFEKNTDTKKATLMCSVLSDIISEAEQIYYDSGFYEKYGSDLEDGDTIHYKNDVRIKGYETGYSFRLSTVDNMFWLDLDPEGNGTFIDKNLNNDSYYRYDLVYKNGKLESMELDYYSTSTGSWYSDDLSSSGQSTNSNSTSTQHNSNNSQSDPYNSSNYNDAQSFADDYYEEFYDYGDYEDDEDAEDAAMEYWYDYND